MSDQLVEISDEIAVRVIPLPVFATTTTTRSHALDTVEKVRERILRRTTLNERGCLLWNGALNATGYGVGWSPLVGGMTSTHRLSYQVFLGGIPADETIHHVCETPRCCNPGHLISVSQRRNVVELSTTSLVAINARKEECDHGHPFDEANTYLYTPEGKEHPKRGCRVCRREARLRWIAKQKRVAS